MAAPYSTLFAVLDAGDDEASYTVPAGQVAVLRDLIVFMYGAGGAAQAIDITRAPKGTLYYTSSTEDVFYEHLELRQVLNPGDTLNITPSGAGSITAMVSGYLLASP